MDLVKIIFGTTHFFWRLEQNLLPSNYPHIVSLFSNSDMAIGVRFNNLNQCITTCPSNLGPFALPKIKQNPFPPNNMVLG